MSRLNDLIGDTAGWSEEWLIQAYFDGQLDEPASCRFEQRLRCEPDLRAELEHQRRLRELVAKRSTPLPSMPRPEVAAWRRQADASAAGEGRVRPQSAGDQPDAPIRIATFRPSWGRPSWNHPLAQAAALILLVFGLAHLNRPTPPSPQPVEPMRHAADIISLDLPQAGTGAYVYEVPESNLTVVWVTGLAETSGGADEPES